VLRSAERLDSFVGDLDESEQEDLDDDEDVQMVSLISETEDYDNEEFAEVVTKTNKYLCKNHGTSADYELLKNICEHDIEILDDQIHNTLNAPLYLGLAGTFVGVIVGLWGVDLNQFMTGSVEASGLQHLLWGVVAAMMASLCGLGMTVFNSVYDYKESVKKNEIDKDKYFDFLRRELMPVLSNSMASSLSSLKSVLGHFVDKFGKNLDSYADSAELLNENLEKQQAVLQEINKLSLTKTASKIAETFVNLKESADKLEIFKTYQEQLNGTIQQVEGAAQHIGEVIQKFDEFNSNLSIVLQNQTVTLDLQQQFKDSIETHFPSGSEGREMWRKEFDMLVEDSKRVTATLNDQLVATTQYIGSFIAQNKSFFETFSQLETILNAMKENSRVQSQGYNDLYQIMKDLRADILDAQKESVEINKALKEEIITLIAERKKYQEQEEQRRKAEQEAWEQRERAADERTKATMQTAKDKAEHEERILSAREEADNKRNAALIAAIASLTDSIKDSKEKASKDSEDLMKAIKELTQQIK
jgi:DNA repair exonuclease SbcCD ATPase subunit